MYRFLYIILVTLNITNVILHSLGCYLLTEINKNGAQSVEIMYIINLSACEAIMNCLELIRRVALLTHLHPDVESTVATVNQYILIVMFTGVSFVFYCDMIYLTLDRLMNILLDIKYPLYWCETKAKYLLSGTWCAGLIMCATVSVLRYSIGFDWEGAFFKYFYPGINIGFIMLAVVTYVFIFKQYRKTRMNPVRLKNNAESQDGENTQQDDSAWTVFRNSRFYISVLLILSFILFMVVPDMTYLMYGIINEKKNDDLAAACWISYAISNCVDAIIYILLQEDVRNLLWKKLGRDGRTKRDIHIVLYSKNGHFGRFKHCAEVVRVVSVTIVNNRYHSIQQYVNSVDAV